MKKKVRRRHPCCPSPTWKFHSSWKDEDGLCASCGKRYREGNGPLAFGAWPKKPHGVVKTNLKVSDSLRDKLAKAETPTRYEITTYGFNYGAAEVTRRASHKGYVVIGIDAGKGLNKNRIDITVSPTGRTIKIVNWNTGKELK